MWRGGLPPRAAALRAPPPAIEFPEESPEPRFDESDVPAELRVANGSQKFVNFTSTIQNQLLLVSLLEHLCHMYTHNPVHSRCLFRILRQAFTRTGLLSPFAFCDEFSTVRLQHNRAITELMKAANRQILNGELDNGDSHAIGEKEVLFEAQTSRYLNEFDEVARLGKGGYGKVYKVRNKLDGQFYAIKKINIKKATRRDCMKVLREVKVLAGLQHPNIVGYHTAWMEQVQTVRPKGNDHCHVQSVESGSSIIFADLTSQEKKSCDSTSLRNLGSESAHNMDLRNDFTNSNSKECMKQNKCELSIELQEDSVSSVSSRSTDEKNHSALGSHSSLDQDASTGTKSCTEECSKSDVALCGEFEPRNIFLHGSDHQVKIGDFGLACKDILWDDADHWFKTERINGLTHTSGVGTCLYASPEQLQGSHYDFKVISNLQQKVRQQEEEIEKLRERIRLLSGEEDEHMRLGSPV
ncbi:eukaryotic translation initiation factor 2-alpha kinase 1 [Grus japonensis]|uniref:Eukaryotic translation initiation factor 2-alpha kinase 1 n=1 Tax=Grus japonensis TaxID=30415 RepID=A0ABC9XHQ2_GRUJA